MYIGLHVKYQTYLSEFNETWIFCTDFRKISKYQMSRKSIQWEPSCSIWKDGQMNMSNLIVMFRNFVNASKTDWTRNALNNYEQRNRAKRGFQQRVMTQAISQVFAHGFTHLSEGAWFITNCLTKDSSYKSLFKTTSRRSGIIIWPTVCSTVGHHRAGQTRVFYVIVKHKPSLPHPWVQCSYTASFPDRYMGFISANKTLSPPSHNSCLVLRKQSEGPKCLFCLLLLYNLSITRL
jgi:hypothetical protein